MPSSDIRCPRCNRLLARKLDNGALEIRRRGKQTVVVQCGMIWCCGLPVKVAKCSLSMEEGIIRDT